MNRLEERKSDFENSFKGDRDTSIRLMHQYSVVTPLNDSIILETLELLDKFKESQIEVKFAKDVYKRLKREIDFRNQMKEDKEKKEKLEAESRNAVQNIDVTDIGY